MESFEWHKEDMLKKPLVRELLRVSEGEVIAVWTEETPHQNAKMGTVRFQGSGNVAELGEYWMLAAVMTLLRVNQVHWEATIAADKAIEGGGESDVYGSAHSTLSGRLT